MTALEIVGLIVGGILAVVILVFAIMILVIRYLDKRYGQSTQDGRHGTFEIPTKPSDGKERIWRD